MGNLIKNKTSIFPQRTSNEQAAFKWNGNIMLQAKPGEDEKSGDGECSCEVYETEGNNFQNPSRGREVAHRHSLAARILIKKLGN